MSPKCFSCILDMLSGPVAGEFLRFFIAFFVSLIVNLGVLFWLNFSFFRVLMIFLFCR